MQNDSRYQTEQVSGCTKAHLRDFLDDVEDNQPL